MMKKIASGIDFFFNKLLPKKFLVWVIATLLVKSQADIPVEYWYISIAYIGGNALSKLAGSAKSKAAEYIKEEVEGK